MLKLISVEIERYEGKSNLCGIKKKFDNFVEAQKYISSQEHSYTDYGYDKHGIDITWENDIKYHFRLDCKHPTNKYYHGNDILDHIKDSIKYYTDSKNILNEWNKEAKIFLEYIKSNCELN